MTTRFALIFGAVVAAGAAAAAQQPQIQNGKIETRQASSVDKEIATISAGATDPVWIGWKVPMIDGRRDTCSWYSDDNYPNGIRGQILETDRNDFRAPQITAPTGPVPLEAGTQLVVMLRIVDKRVERLRYFSDDCPLDANGHTVYWLNGATIADSLKMLEALTHPDYNTLTRGAADNIVSSSIAAIALHKDTGADAILDRLAMGTDSNLRSKAAMQLGSARTAHGFTMLKDLIGTAKNTDLRLELVNDIANTRQPQTADFLLSLAKSDPDPQVRAKAVYYVPARGGERVVPDVMKIIESDLADQVRRDAVTGLSLLPADTWVPIAIKLVRESKDQIVRTQAVSRLRGSKDPRAVSFLQDLIR